MTPFHGIAGYGRGSESADLTVDFRREGGNVQFDGAAFARDLGAPLPPVLLDWLEIAVAVHFLDLAAPRGAHENWTRDLHLNIAVRELDVWESAKGDLINILSGLSGDNLELAFEASAQRSRAASGTRPSRDFDGIALLSGGLDSFGGGLDLLDRGKRPLFLSHRTGNTTVSNAQRAAHRHLEARAGRGLPWLPVTVRPRVDRPIPFPDDADREETQRMRSFLFLSLACVAASALRLETVWIHENGILTYPLPLTAARIGSRSTRSTHPRLLRAMEKLALRVADWRLAIANPFHLKTKRDVIARIARARCADAIPDLVTCWRIGRIAHPCGICLPCLLRQLAVAGCGIDDAEYERVILAELPEQLDREAAEPRRNLGELLRLVRDFLVLPDEAIMLRYPEVFLASRHGARATQILNLYRRFASETHEALKARYPAASALLGSVDGLVK